MLKAKVAYKLGWEQSKHTFRIVLATKVKGKYVEIRCVLLLKDKQFIKLTSVISTPIVM